MLKCPRELAKHNWRGEVHRMPVFGNKGCIFGYYILHGLPYERAVAYLCSQTSLVGGGRKNPDSFSQGDVCFPVSAHLPYTPVWSNTDLVGALEWACFDVQIWYLVGWDLLQTQNKFCVPKLNELDVSKVAKGNFEIHHEFKCWLELLMGTIGILAKA